MPGAVAFLVVLGKEVVVLVVLTDPDPLLLLVGGAGGASDTLPVALVLQRDVETFI